MLSTATEIINAYKAKLTDLGVSAAPQQSIVHEVKHTFDNVDLTKITLEWSPARQNSNTKQWFTTLAVKGLEPERCFYAGNGYKALASENEALPATVPSVQKLCIATLVVQESRKTALKPKIDALVVAERNEQDITKKAALKTQLEALEKQLTPEGNAALVVY